PGTRDAQVQVAMTLDHDQAEPFQLTVPAGGATSLNVNDEPRVPKGDGHTAVVTSTNGVGVVVERTFEATGPAPRQGSEIVMGARRNASRWAFVSGAAVAGLDEWLMIYNPQPRAV